MMQGIKITTVGNNELGPITLTIVDIGETTISFSWNDVVNADYYRVQYKTPEDATYTMINNLNVNFYELTGLLMNTDYTIVVNAYNETGFVSDYDNVRTIIEVPLISGSNFTDSGFTVTWTEPPYADHYYIFYKKSVDTSWSAIPNITTNSHTFTSLQSETDYDVYVRAFNDNNSNLRGTSTTETYTTLDTAVNDLGVVSPEIITFEPTSLTVVWNSVTNALTYDVYMRNINDSGYTLMVSDTTDLSYVPTNLQRKTRHDFKITAKNNSFTRNGYTSGSTTIEHPELTLSNPTDSGFTATWTEPPYADYYSIFYKKSVDSSWSTVGNITTNTHTFTSLQGETDYDVYVRAFNDPDLDLRGTSNTETISTSGVIDIGVITISFDSVQYTSIDVSWNNVTNAVLYDLEYRSQDDNEYTYLLNQSSSTNFSTTNLMRNTRYYFKVTAYNSYGQSVYNINSEVTLIEIPALTLSNPTENGFTATWTEPPYADYYYIFYKETSSSSYNVIEDITNSPYTFNNLNLNTEYSIYIRAYDNNEFRLRGTSNEETITTNDNISLGTITMNIIEISYTSITVNWNSVENADYYEVAVNEIGDSDPSFTILNSNTTNLNYTYNDLKRDTEYEFRVRAYGLSDFVEDVKSGITLIETPFTTLSNPTYNGFTLNWTTVPYADTYSIIYEATDGTSSVITIPNIPSTQTSYTITSMVSNKEYDIFVRAYGVNNTPSADSNIVTDTTLQSVPGNNQPPVIGTLSEESHTLDIINLQWTPATDDYGIASYRVYYTRSDDQIQESFTINDPDALSASITNIGVGTYYIFIIAIDIYGVYSEESNLLIVSVLPMDNSSPGEQITKDTNIIIYFDSSGSMDSTLPRLQDMIYSNNNDSLRSKLLKYYNYDDELYREKVKIIQHRYERTYDMLNLEKESAIDYNDVTQVTYTNGNVIVLVFQDENDNYFGYNNDTGEYFYDEILFNDLVSLNTSLSNYGPGEFKGSVFQVIFEDIWGDNTIERYVGLLTDVRDGNAPFTAPEHNLVGSNNITYEFDVLDGSSYQYYTDLVVNKLQELGVNIF